ncbi:MAG: 2-oxo acid dehydrogenase subunit E2 [Bacteroidales bacterium]|nr:2-oxo acid dehydrogenase subunit E2 [Bacteroidales bacterium]
MAKIEIELPPMGEGITEATITKFLKNVGDFVEEEEALIEIATDKVDSEITTPESGTVEKFLFEEGDEVPIGAIVAILNTDSDETPSNQTEVEDRDKIISSDKIDFVAENKVKPEQKNQENQEKSILFVNKTSSGNFISPLVRSIAHKEGISVEELDNIQGSGIEGRITKKDILNYLKNKTSKADNVVAEQIPTNKITAQSSGFEIIEMDRMRKLIAHHMVNSKQISAHVTSFIEVDVTTIVQWRNKVKDAFLKKYGEKITFTPIFIEAAVQALRDYPMVNVSVEGDTIIKKNFINIGMATALPSGNLIVPVIKSAGEMNLLGLTKAVNDLANRARNNKLKPDEIQGGTFTITNLGSFGNITGTPIINQPEVAILAVGAIKKKPAVIESPQGDMIGIRQLMIVSMSYDHRVVDGSLGGMFIKRFADILEQFNPDREI